MPRAVLAMSGGVDSSAAAVLLTRAGYEVIGLFMRHGARFHDACETPSGRKGGCCTAADAADARRVAQGLGMAFYALDFEAEFERIIEYFVREYSDAKTPNPCIVCNTWLKFGKLFEYADGVGADFVATGHYARITDEPDASKALRRGKDVEKDQSYVLFGIDRPRLNRLLFPVGEFTKPEIRRLADEAGLAVADKPDSQEICFVPDQNHAAFVKSRKGEFDTSGEIVTTGGEVVGEHDGYERFTVGQRKGLRVAMGEPFFVTRIEPETRRVVIGPREELARSCLTAAEANWLVDPPEEPFRATVKIRYRDAAADATVTPLCENRFRLDFDTPRYGVAPGQAAVCYDGDRVLGGGWIERT